MVTLVTIRVTCLSTRKKFTCTRKFSQYYLLPEVNDCGKSGIFANQLTSGRLPSDTAPVNRVAEQIALQRILIVMLVLKVASWVK